MDIQRYIDDYVSWLKNEITFSKVGEYYEINTPFLDNHNDYLRILRQSKKEKKYILQTMGIP